MENLEAIGRALLGNIGAEKMNQVMGSQEAQAAARIVDPEAVEKAAKSGDMATLKKMLTQIMSTDEGKRLAAMLSKNMDSK